MPVKLDLKRQTKVDEDAKKEKKVVAPESKAPEKKVVPSTKKRGQGRPKGVPTVTRSLRIRADNNEKLVAEQLSTGLSFNELVNRALEEYLK